MFIRVARRAAVVVAALALTGAVGGVVWHEVAEGRAAQVQVVWSRAPRCTGATVGELADQPHADERASGPLIEARRGMRCTLTVAVSNGSGARVHLDDAVLPFVGRGGGAVLEADTASDPASWAVQPAAEDLDAVRVLDVDLDAGEDVSFDVPLVFRERGCSGGAGGGGFMTIHDFPTVTVDTLLFSFERPSGTDLVHTQVSPARGCAAGDDS